MSVWDDWYDQTVAVEPYQGAGGNGPIYGDPYALACLIDDTVRLVRNPDAVEVVSSTTIHAAPDTDAPAGSLITFSDGRTSQVITSSVRHAGDDLDLPGVEVALE